MTKAAYWQRGESLDYVNRTTETIDANTIVPIGERIGVTGTVIKPGEVGSLHVTGVYEIEKTDTEEIVMGASVFFDGTGITGTSGGDGEEGYIMVGYAAQTAAAVDRTVFVKLMG